MMRRVLALMALSTAILGCKQTGSLMPQGTPPPSSMERSSQNERSWQPRDNSEQRGANSGQQRPRRARPSQDRQPGDFDFYLLTLSWSPEFCVSHPGSEECGARPGFVVHGLWPQNADGTYPEDCSNADGPANPQQYTDLIPTASLVEHEWQAHGTCSGLAPDAYFAQVRNARNEISIPTQFSGPAQPGALSPAAIIDSFDSVNSRLPAGSVAISCGNNRLTAVEVCLSKSLVPEACPSVRSCGATVVQITSR